MSDSEEDVILKDDDGFGEQVDLDDFSFISTEAPTNEKDGNIYDQSDNEENKKQSPSKSQDASLDGKTLKQKKRERSPSPTGYNNKQERQRRIHSSDSDSDQNEITRNNNNRPPPPMVTPATEVHVDLEEIKSFQGKKAVFAEVVLNSLPGTAIYYTPAVDNSSFNPVHSATHTNVPMMQERYRDYTSKKAQSDRPNSNTPMRSQHYNAPMRNTTPTQQHNTAIQHPPNYNQPPAHVEGAPPIPGVALTQQQFDEIYRYKVNTNNNNNTKSRDNKQIREPTLQIANPLAPKVPDEIILEEQRRVQLKLEVSKIVVKALTKYLKEGKISNKDDFKHLSRKLTHKIMLKEQGIKHAMSEKRTKSIYKFIDNWFRKKGGSYIRKSKPWEKPPSVVNFVPPLHPGM